MSVTTYSFVGATSPAGVSSHKALWGSVAGTTIPVPDTGTEGLQADYDAIEANDASRWQNQVAPGNQIPYKQYRFYVTKASGDIYQALSMTIVGYGGWAGVPYYLFAIRNFATALWETIGTHGAFADSTITGARGTAGGSYVSGSYIWLASRGSLTTGAFPSNDFCNYIELTVTTGPAALGAGSRARGPLSNEKFQMGEWNLGWGT